MPDDLTPQERRLRLIQELYKRRSEARKAKDFILADEIRHMLESVGENVVAHDRRVLGPVKLND